MSTNIYVIPKVCLKYRIHNAQISTAKVKEQNELCKNIYLSNLKRLSDNFKEEDIKYLLYLSKKDTTTNISKKDIQIFINNIIELNKEKNIYDSKSLRKILYYRYFVSNLKRLNFLEFIYCIFEANLIGLYIRKKIKIIKNKNV